MSGLPGAFGYDLKDSPALKVVQYRDIVVTLAKTLFIKTGIARRAGPAQPFP